MRFTPRTLLNYLPVKPTERATGAWRKAEHSVRN
jgi:hypothetical protein